MPRYEITWFTRDHLVAYPTNIPCCQVYVWVVSLDQHVVIVSKDGKQWQLPGGKPEINETLKETSIREVEEETGLDISDIADQLNFFGYQTVSEIDNSSPPYTQVRFMLRLDVNASQLDLHADMEDQNQNTEDAIRFVKAIPLDQLGNYIPWLPASEEYGAFKAQLSRNN